MYNFDEIIDRRGTNSMKWSPTIMDELFDESEALPLWVADMDFRTVPEVIEATKRVAEFGIYGYVTSDKHNLAFVDWVQRRMNYTIAPEWVINTPGVVTAFSLAIQTFTKPGDKVLIQRPVYYPFTNAIVNNGRQVVSNTLVNQKGRYEIDFEDFKRKVQDPDTTLFILCSPHNPVSRSFSKEELVRMMDLCVANDVLVVSDEIHNDLIMPETDPHVTVPSLGEKYANHSITCMAPSKTFNLAGMHLSNIVIPNDRLRHQFQRTMSQVGIGGMNPFAIEATTAAYTHGEPWLEGLLDYLYGNYQYLRDTFAKELPEVVVTPLEATYLVWLDFNALEISQDILGEKIFKDAKVALDGGDWFGPEGEGFMRLNLASPRSVIQEAVEKIIRAIH